MSNFSVPAPRHPARRDEPGAGEEITTQLGAREEGRRRHPCRIRAEVRDHRDQGSRNAQVGHHRVGVELPLKRITPFGRYGVHGTRTERTPTATASTNTSPLLSVVIHAAD